MPKNISDKVRNCRNSRRRGNDYERTIVNELKELGFNVCTSRSESKSMDDKKIDIIDKDGQLPYLQLKRTQKTPDYFKIASECPLKDREFAILWNKQVATNKTFRSVGQLVMITKDYFYKLIRKYYGKL